MTAGKDYGPSNDSEFFHGCRVAEKETLKRVGIEVLISRGHSEQRDWLSEGVLTDKLGQF